jgi:putative ABC transport system substrate-binding protein
MRRREFIMGLSGTVVLPVAALAQQQRAMPRVGLLSIGADPANPVNFLPFLQQFRALGYIEGQNVALERRFADGQVDLLAGFVSDLVDQNVDVIVTTGGRLPAE